MRNETATIVQKIKESNFSSIQKQVLILLTRQVRANRDFMKNVTKKEDDVK